MSGRKSDQLAQNLVLSVSNILADERACDSALFRILQSMCKQLNWQASSFWKFDETKGTLLCEAFYTTVPCPAFEEATRSIELSPGIGLPGCVVRDNAPVWIQDVVVSPNFPRFGPAEKDGLHSAIAFPVNVSGKVVGVFEFFSEKIRQPDEGLLDAFSVLGTEIGQLFERNRYEKELAQQTRLNEYFRIFAENVDECVFVSSPGLTEHHYISPAFDKIWGYSRDEAYVNAMRWSDEIVPEHKERVMEYVKRLQGFEMPEPEIEYQIRTKDGTLKWLRVKIFAAVDQQDGSYQICGSVSDVSERKEAEQRMSDFYSMVSHELKTPLTSVKGVFALMEKGKAGELPMKAQELSKLGRKECDRMIRLINDMLDIKKIEAGKLQLIRQNFYAGDVVEQTLDALRGLASERNIKLKEDIASPVSINADKDRMVQVLTNLVSNALKFSPDESLVLVNVKQVDQMVRFSVVDNGPGINKDEQLKLFKVFPQIEHNVDVPTDGTGLGLAICKGIIDEHDGFIGVISDEGAGATFWFEVAIASPDEQ